MPYSAEHKARTRARIIQSARRLFNTRGFGAVSIDEIMAEAGLTRGGFYNHFKSKDDLLAEAVAEILRSRPPKDWSEDKVDFNEPDKGKLCSCMVSSYLSRGHLEDTEHACSLVAYAADAALGSAQVKRAYQQVLEAMTGCLEQGAGGRENALAVATLCVGGMVLARAVDDRSLAREIQQAAKNAALHIAGAGTAPARAPRKRQPVAAE